LAAKPDAKCSKALKSGTLHCILLAVFSAGPEKRMKFSAGLKILVRKAEFRGFPMVWKKEFQFVALALLLSAAGGYAETNQTAAADDKHPAACPHCGFTPTNPVAAAGSTVTNRASTNDWKSSVYGGFAAKSGNTVERSYNYGADLRRVGKIYRGTLQADGRYSRTEDQVTTSKSEASGELRRMLDEHWFAYGVLSATHDDLKDLSYRVKTGPGIGYYFVDSKELTADVSSGPLYVHEKTADGASGYLAWRFAQGFNWQITGTFRVWTLTEAFVDTTDTAAYTIAAKAGVESKISGNLSLVVMIEDDYDSLPETQDEIEKNDFEISTGLRYSF